MYVVDITRTKDEMSSDILLGKDSMDAKRKTIDYIQAYAFANYNVCIDDDVIDQNLNIDSFSFKEFFKNNYSVNIDKDLIIQAFPTNKDNCLLVKYYDEEKDGIPLIYVFNKNDNNKANNLMVYLINDALINKNVDDLSNYEKIKQNYNCNLDIYKYDSIKCEKISLYNNELFIEELLNNFVSYNQLKRDKFDIKI